MEVCGGQTHSIVRYGIDQLLPERRDADPRAGLSGLRHAGRLCRQGDRDRRPAGRDPLLLRRHAARARQRAAISSPPRRAAPTCASSIRRSTRSPSPAPTRTARSSSSPSASRRRRRRTPWPPTGRSAKASRNFSHARLARAGAAGDARDPRRASQPRSGLPRRRPCLHHHGLRGIRADRRALPRADRRDRLRAARHPGRRLHDACASSKRGAPRSRTSTAARSSRGRQRSGAGADARGLYRGAAALARHRRDRRERARHSSDAYRDFDAEARFGAVGAREEEAGECIAGLVLCGEKKPSDCPAFGTRCTPEHPLGVTMVSSEGACAAYYRYRGVPVAAE